VAGNVDDVVVPGHDANVSVLVHAAGVHRVVEALKMIIQEYVRNWDVTAWKVFLPCAAGSKCS
jgi:hypothetical protein